MSKAHQAIQVHSPHPLDPLSSSELTLAVKIIRQQAKLDSRTLFEQVRLKAVSYTHLTLPTIYSV